MLNDCYQQQFCHNGKQAFLLFAQDFQREQKTYGFGHKLDLSVHQALQERTFALVEQFADIDLIVVKNGQVTVPQQARTLAQRGDNFETRFLNAFFDSFALGYERVVAIGCDIPTLTAEDIAQALSCPDLVLGPTYDGGFYLAALRPQDLNFFAQLPWRSQQLLGTLQLRIQQGEHACSLLARHRDIDHASDAHRCTTLLLELAYELLGLALLPVHFCFEEIFSPYHHLPDPRLNSLPPPTSRCPIN